MITWLITSLFTMCIVVYAVVFMRQHVIELYDKCYQFCVASVFALEILLAFACDGYAHPSSAILLVCRHATIGWVYLVIISATVILLYLNQTGST